MTQTNLRHSQRPLHPTEDRLVLAFAKAMHKMGRDPGAGTEGITIYVPRGPYRELWREGVLGRDEMYHVRWRGFRVKCDTERPAELEGCISVVFSESRAEKL